MAITNAGLDEITTSDHPVDQGSDDGRGKCPMDSLLRSIMGPWTTYIIWVLETEGTLRFGALKARMPGISSKVLTERLRHLEETGLISRTYKPTVPPAVSYTLTSRGHELRDGLKAINEIALKWQAEDAARNP